MPDSHPAAALRQRLREPAIVRSLGVFDVFSALVAQQEGLDTLFLGGFGAAASLLGLPDLGLLTMSEMADVVRRITGRVHIPLIADGDTGYGDVQNVARTVREFERAGAAGIILEDQTTPKRCGHFAGKQIISADHMVEKLRCAIETRERPEFVIIARTDSLELAGFEESVRRANLYGEAGADLCFIEAPQTIEQLRRIPGEVAYPMLVNMLTGGRTPILSADELQSLGFKIVVCPVAALLTTRDALRRLAGELRSVGRVDHLPETSFDDLKSCLVDGSAHEVGGGLGST